MEQQQVLALIAGERQKQIQEMQEVFQTSQDRWNQVQDCAMTQHQELMAAMGEKSRLFVQFFQAPQQPMMGAPLVNPAPQQLVGANPLAWMHLHKITPDDEPDDFLSAFERTANAAGWPQEQWAARLLPCLAGETLAAFQTLNPDLASNYQNVKAHILDYLGYTHEHYRQKFRSAKMGDYERPKALVQRLTKMAERWLQPCLADPRALFAEIIKEQCLESMPKELRGWVQKQGCKSLMQVLEVSEAYLDARGSAGEVRLVPSSRGESGKESTHTNRHTIPQNPPFREMKTPEPGGPARREGPKCLRCGKVGHIQRNCRVRRDFVIGRGGCDIISGEYRVQVAIAGRKVNALVDTGAEQSVVSQSFWHQLLRKEQSKKIDKKVPIVCIHGVVRKYPLHPVVVDYGGVRRHLSVAVLDSSPYPVILGRDWLTQTPVKDLAGVGKHEQNDSLTGVAKQVLGAHIPEESGHFRRPSWRRSQGWGPHRKRWTPVIRWVLLSDNAHAPTQAYSRAAGFDLYAAEELIIPSKSRALVHTDLQVSMPPGSYLRIAPRSGLALEHAIDVAAGVVDPDFRGNLGVVLVNQGNADYSVKPGQRIAQMICERIWHAKLERWTHLRDTKRGQKGFGSTGNTEGAEIQCTSPEGTQKSADTQGENLGALREDIKVLKGDLQQISAQQREEWKKELEAAQHQWSILIRKQREGHDTPTQEPPEGWSKKLTGDIVEQCQQEYKKLQSLVTQMDDQVQQVRIQLASNLSQQQKVVQNIKDLEMVCKALTDKQQESEKWSKQNHIPKEQVEQQKQQVSLYQNSLKGLEKGMADIQGQVNKIRDEELGSMAEVMTALAQQVTDMATEEEEEAKSLEAKYGGPVLRWPDDFRDPEPPTVQTGKKGGKARNCY
uniref:Uncharacterized protein LOC117355817 n=1 Tax=Geotrypetes seraphini TaxID=260995 RepID=A0A6P8PR59_GEOSA|nr:uncharacterized protein LOC117355817 [Geotrypetes seraphini]XP_033790763.1 uncharacterized protein LOC117355817 [Geotrypetes seraphini]